MEWEVGSASHVTSGVQGGPNTDTIGYDYSTDSNYDYNDDKYLYSGFSFERPIYLYIWQILVILTCLLNIVVISVLLRKKMRSPTYIILVAISISDSLTGLVTLPTYTAVFKQYQSYVGPTYLPDSTNVTVPESTSSDYGRAYPHEATYYLALPKDGYFLSKTLCDWFMISKFFLSKSFHTVSVWLTLFLATQRFLSVKAPFKALVRAFNMKMTIIVCVTIFILAPFLHIYHLFNDKSDDGNCEWLVEKGESCVSDCIYFWFVLMLGHLLPSLLLIGFTVMFVYTLMKTTSAVRRSTAGDSELSRRSSSSVFGRQLSTSGSGFLRRVSTIGSGIRRRMASSSECSGRQRENHHASIIVTAIVILFLIPEVPFAGFLVYNLVCAHADNDTDLKANRAIHAAYEILLVLSFNANFYIYTFFNRRFRRVLWETTVSPMCRLFSLSGFCSCCQYAERKCKSYSGASKGQAHGQDTKRSRNIHPSNSAIELKQLNIPGSQNDQMNSTQEETVFRESEEKAVCSKATIQDIPEGDSADNTSQYKL